MKSNKELIRGIEQLLTDISPLTLGVNKKNELVRLLYEICYAGKIEPTELIGSEEGKAILEDGKGDFFSRFKAFLLKMRYPSIRKGRDPHLMPLKFHDSSYEHKNWDFNLRPKHIFVEQNVIDREWTKDFILLFPGVKVEPVKKISEAFYTFRKKNSLEMYNNRAENIFIIKHKTAFLKICPCSNGCERCGYWILNVGFGCPIDCAYCYLQTYSNAPGIVLPANIEDYFDPIAEFDRKLTKRVRIGTGEFTDSLALDKYTGYSRYLIPFFKDMKNMILEIKTKVSNIDNILDTEPNDNVVISWSVNPRNIASVYEQGASSIDDRIQAALNAARRGYNLGFHFDPVIYYKGWEDDYKAIVEELFSYDILRDRTLWISLGTLRFTAGLNQIAEQRFSDNDIYYQGEFFADEDGKLRYPGEVRVDIYNKMIKWIKKLEVPAWIYLCMELSSVWDKTGLRQREYA
jgi:spore photoproduct lyase